MKKSVIARIKEWARLNSLWVLHFNSGACNGCDIEILDALTPRYDVERFGIRLKASPRHADVLLASGPVNHQSAARLKRIYDQMPDPKIVIAVGTCACSGGVFRGCYNIHSGIDSAVPVDAYITGCPVKPEAIIDAVAKLINKVKAA
ncbi:MAG TPA: NADH-quinone oxidoreductase subunit B family protein [bacterium]|nr:NADH-quinone oxidoreductase subunit B family protein [bacterium]